jgi:simple sugar transport system permease protein
VYRLKYVAVTMSGALAGLGGGVLSIEAARVYREGQVAGRGFIGLAALIFGNWRPGGLALGAGFFGFTDALQLRDAGSVHALLLFVTIVLAIFLLLALRAGQRRRAAILLAVTTGCMVWYLTQDTLPDQLVAVLPNVATLVVLGLFAQRLRPPAADGLRWRRGDRS